MATAPEPTSDALSRLQKVRRVSVAQSVTERLAALISEGHVRPGEHLPTEQELMARLSVGRSSVREAVRSLALLGIVETRPRRGTIVVSPVVNPFAAELRQSVAYWALKDLFEVRALLEADAAARAARNASEAQLREIRRHAEVIERQIARDGAYFEENLHFHLSIAKASGNHILFHCLSSIIGGLRDMRERTLLRRAGVPEQDIIDHRAILDAIRDRDAERARRAMESHLYGSIERLGEPTDPEGA